MGKSWNINTLQKILMCLMELLSQLSIPRPKGDASIQLLYGDLTAIPTEFAVDILAISAFRGDYRTNRETLMQALFNAGISVADLAIDKEIDLINPLSCWLSKPLTEVQQARFNFRKILCFEPMGPVETVDAEVDNLFRGINTFALDEHHDEIAMPVLTTGDRKFPMEVMLPALLDTALFWLENGLPLNSLKIVLHRPEQLKQGLPIFDYVSKQYDLKKSVEAKQISAKMALADTIRLYRLPKMDYTWQELVRAEIRTSSSGPVVTGDPEVADQLNDSAQANDYDYFVSYSHRHLAAVREFVDALQVRNPQLRIFYDRTSIPPGGLWIKLISDAIQQSKNVICILTPEYSQSKVCWDEFQCAYIMESRKKVTIRMINFINDVNLPPVMAIYSYLDCTEGDLVKLKGSVSELTDG